VLDAIAVCGATARQEQEWIAFALRGPVSEPALRVWTYRAPAVVLGCSGRSTAAMSDRATAAGADVCIRPTGGAAVLAGPWLLGTSVVLPPQHPVVIPSIPQSFRWFGLAHAAWLQSIGIYARAAPAPALSRGCALSWACFAGFSHWEVEAGGGKIVGLAQARRRNGVLFSSAVLIAPPPWELLCGVLGEPGANAALLAGCTSSCTQFLGPQAGAVALAPSLLQWLWRDLSVAEAPLSHAQASGESDGPLSESAAATAR
jgi:lipoate-protein ligase A